MYIITCIIFFIIGNLAIFSGRKYLLFIRKIKKWPSTRGRLQEKHLGNPILVLQDTPDDKRIFAKYTYKVNEKEYKSENVYSLELMKGERTSLSRMAKKKMEKIENEPLVFYNPNNPKESFLYSDSIWWGVLLIISGILFSLCSIIELFYIIDTR